MIGAALEEVESENYRRLMINLRPRFGKTTLATAMFPAWYIGKHPERSVIVATYNETYRWDLGRKIRDIIRLPQYAQVFPELEIKQRAAAVNRVETTAGGVIFWSAADPRSPAAVVTSSCSTIQSRTARRPTAS